MSRFGIEPSRQSNLVPPPAPLSCASSLSVIRFLLSRDFTVAACTCTNLVTWPQRGGREEAAEVLGVAAAAEEEETEDNIKERAAGANGEG